MAGAQPLESHPQPAADRGAPPSAPRSTPLTVVSRAVAGDDLAAIAADAHAALSRPVVIAVPELGPPVLWPPTAVSPEALAAVVRDAAAMLSGTGPPGVEEVTVPIRVAQEDVGIVTLLGHRRLDEQDRAWLEATAAAAAVARLLHDSRPATPEVSVEMVLRRLIEGRGDDLGAALRQAARLDVELYQGGLAICGQAVGELPANALLLPVAPALVVKVAENRVVALAPLRSATAGASDDAAELLAVHWRELGLNVATSSPRRDPAQLREALREAEVLLELSLQREAALADQEQTYRLLIGVLLRDPDELQALRADTIAPLAAYDTEHETALVGTLQVFLAHHGSTTETAEAMQLHRHTVGYRLARVHEVSGLSPYASAGRERLSLGLKAHQILEADERRGLGA